MKTIITLLLTLLSLQSVAQEVAGRVLDEKKEPMISAMVAAYQNGIIKGGTITDYDGNYVMKPLTPGTYDVLITAAGYDSIMITGVIVDAGKRTTQNCGLVRSGKALTEVRIIAYKNPLINHDGSTHILTREEIKVIPTTEVSDFVALSPAVYQSQRGAGTLYIIDGVRVQGTAGLNMAQGSAELQPTEPNYKTYRENDFKVVLNDPLSTMSVDVDRASYSNIRRIINAGQKPPANAVRIEEMINYFEYDYPQPQGKDPVSITTELTNCPWNAGHKLLHIGLQARNMDVTNRPLSNLVFLIDVSGSMNTPERLPLLVAGMKMLVKNLDINDKVAIVAYAGNAGLVLPATCGSDKQAILDALDRLSAGGSTAGGEGIELAYKVAKDNFIKGSNNRVILATDGDFNVGVSSEKGLEKLITKKRETGIFLTCLGFGTDNFKDAKMELLADKGNGNYAYIDNIQEAQKTLISEFGATLFTVAKDVKAQIEFNPASVQGYRLVGYEDRLLNKEDFKDDKKDAGEMGAGHTVTIIYEVIPTGSSSQYTDGIINLKYQQQTATGNLFDNELATVKFRYKQPDGDTSIVMEHTIANVTTDIKKASDNSRFASAVAMFGMIMSDSKYKGQSDYAGVISMAKGSRGEDKDGYRSEFIRLVKAMQEYDLKVSAK